MITLDEIAARLSDFAYGMGSPVSGLELGLHRALSCGMGYGFERAVPFDADPDSRRMNWKETLSTLEFMVNQFREERNMCVVEIDDLSASQCIDRKQSVVAMIRALFGFVTGTHRDRFAAYGVTDTIESELTVPRAIYKSRALELAEQVLTFKAEKTGGGLKDAVRMLPARRSLILLVSDFLDAPETYTRLLPLLTNHAVVALAVRDPHEMELPAHHGIARFRDPETGKQTLAWLNKKSRNRFRLAALTQRQEITSLFQAANIDCVWLDGSRDDVDVIADYFTQKEGT